MIRTIAGGPLRIASKAKARFDKHLHMWRFGNHGRKHFHSDPRYDLDAVTRGFAPQLDHAYDDGAIIERICAAYNRAEDEHRSTSAGQALSESWRQLLNQRLLPFGRALLQHDIPTLQTMLRNFYRDPCSTGLMAAPGGLSKAYFNVPIRDIYRHFYLSHVLYRLDYWSSLTAQSFSVRDLAGPGVGNPFGFYLDGTHIPVGAEFSHYCAQRVGCLIDPSKSLTTVAEFGGGFGAIAYYLVRDHTPLNYINFDTPERIALSSYYLMQAFPKFTVRLYGEDKVAGQITLLPFFAIDDMPQASVDFTFSFSGFSNLTPNAAEKTLTQIANLSKQGLLFIGNEASSRQFSKAAASFVLAEKRELGWHSHKVSGAGVGGAAGLAASTLIEQTFFRKSETNLPSTVASDFIPAEAVPR